MVDSNITMGALLLKGIITNLQPFKGAMEAVVHHLTANYVITI
jgi:hypothetical protein